MSILVTSDWHLDDSPRNQYRHDFQKWLLATVQKYKPNRLLILGDIAQSKDGHNAWLVNKIVGHIYKLSQICHVTILRGNHDYLHIDHPFFAFLNQIENVTWINNPTRVEIDGYNCLFLPHTRDYKKDWKGLLSTPDDWIFAHNTFEGAEVESGKRLSGIPQSIFRKDAYIISGDVHVPQELEKVIYVGSPYRINFGDKFKPRIILIKGKGYASIYCPGPRKHLLKIKTLNDLIDNTEIQKGDLLKVQVELSPNQYDDWQEIKNSIRVFGEEEGYIMEIIQPLVELQSRTRKRKQEFKSDEDLLHTYAKRRQVSEDVLATGLKLIEE